MIQMYANLGWCKKQCGTRRSGMEKIGKMGGMHSREELG